MQMIELQNGFVVLADTMIQELDRSSELSSQAADDRKQWEARLVELDTVNRSHIEHLDRKFHELNLWQQRVEGLAQGLILQSDDEPQTHHVDSCSDVRDTNALIHARLHRIDLPPHRWENRCMLAGLSARVSELQSRLVRQEGLASIAADSIAVMRAEKADVSSIAQECEQIRYARVSMHGLGTCW
jgi:hypothetical protein